MDLDFCVSSGRHAIVLGFEFNLKSLNLLLDDLLMCLQSIQRAMKKKLIGRFNVNLFTALFNSSCDVDLFVITVSIIDGGDFQDAVGIYREGDIDLGDTFSSRGNTTKSKLSEQVVVLVGLFLALVYIDINLSTVVVGGAEDFARLVWKGRVMVDQFAHDAVGFGTK